MFNLSQMNVEVISHDRQRYNTVGDYSRVKGKILVLVSDMGDWKLEYLIAYHELTEIALCIDAGITDKMIDDFDFWFEEKFSQSESYSEPGDHPDCPYYSQHQFATKLEKIMADELGVDWVQYEEKIHELMLVRESLDKK